MYIHPSVLNQSEAQEKYVVTGLDGFITCVLDSKESAQRQARLWLRIGHARENIICKLATLSEIIAAIDSEVERQTEHVENFKSPCAADQLVKLAGFKQVFLSL